MLIVEKFCAQSISHSLSKHEEELIATFIRSASTVGVNYEELNELMLLLNQRRIERGFFSFIFEKDKIKLQELKAGVTKFRGYAMLKYGNFKFAFNSLSKCKIRDEVEKKLLPYSRDKSTITKSYHGRPSKTTDINKISKSDTFYTGYISGRRLDDYKEKIKYKRQNKEITEDEHHRLMSQIIKDSDKCQNIIDIALKNADVYLTWDFMDIYIATSMRYKWEYEETFEFISMLFKNKKILRMNLRYFDPTQSKCAERIDKGIVESLMLKRAKCTIYMTQELDTLGKDSELAATLAQGKPVIAYVPEVNLREHTKKIFNYSIEYFIKRYYTLKLEGIWDERKYRPMFGRVDSNYSLSIRKWIEESEKRMQEAVDESFEAEIKRGPQFLTICRLFSLAESYSYSARYSILSRTHPLAIQVHLDTGIANGVLVLRDIKRCSELLLNILTNDMSFTIKHEAEKARQLLISNDINWVAFFEKLKSKKVNSNIYLFT
ncbi:MAG: hypothetical protein MUF78_02065, partial [Candidatus Edwardsbacteria bacterium]|nr:hypothetical protein [Candidatus Edwardsbacteria bacterium]